MTSAFAEYVIIESYPYKIAYSLCKFAYASTALYCYAYIGEIQIFDLMSAGDSSHENNFFFAKFVIYKYDHQLTYGRTVVLYRRLVRDDFVKSLTKRR